MTAVAGASRRGDVPALALAAAAIVVSVVADPDTTHVPLCPLHAATGLSCPLCGGLRAMHALSRGAVSSAIHDNAMVVAALALAPLVVVGLRMTSRDEVWRRHIAVALFATAVVFAIVRNMPFATTLRPG